MSVLDHPMGPRVNEAFRSVWRRYDPNRRHVLLTARRAAAPGQRHKWEYQCALCQQWHLAREVEVDHMEPVNASTCTDVNELFGRVFAPVEKLRVLCKVCHRCVSAEQRKATRRPRT